VHRDLFFELIADKEKFTKEQIAERVLLHVNVQRVSFKKGIEELENVIVPETESLREIAKHYEKKYKIEIFVVNAADFQSLMLERNVISKPYGVIVFDNDGLHVAPVLVNPVLKQTLLMDVLDPYAADTHDLTKVIFSSLDGNYEIFRTKNTRQADGYSCRTEATTILRNMLLYLSDKDVSNVDEVGFDKILMSAEVSYKPQVRGAKETKLTLVELPLECDYIDQISRKEVGLSEVEVIRRKFSKQPSKRIRPEKVSEFRMRHTLEVTNFCEYVTRKDASRIVESLGGNTHEGTLGHFNYVIKALEGGRVKIDVRNKISVNVYQILKGFKNAFKYAGEKYTLHPSLYGFLKPGTYLEN
jgi:hypothetical protein